MLAWRLTDVPSILEAVALFALFTVPPGYAAAWFADLFSFRQSSLLRRIAISVPLSIGITPILVYWPWRFFSIHAVWIVFAAVWISAAIAVVRAPPATPASQRALWITGATAAFLWTTLVLVEIPDIRDGDKLYSSTVSYDYLSRIPMTARIARQNKLPALTPFLNPGSPALLRYHYFWPMVAALVKILGGPSMLARSAVIAGAIWCGIALLAVIALYLRLFRDDDDDASPAWRAYAVGFALLSITGLDILPVLFPGWLHHNWLYALAPTVEWWNEQVTGWLDAMLWVPHHIAALVAGLLAVLILFRSRAQRAVLLAGVLLASCVGLSIYVALVFALILAAWGLALWNRGRDWRPLQAVGVAGALSLVLALPFLLDMRGDGHGARILQLTIRQFWFEGERFSSLGLAGGRGFLSFFARLMFLPLNYFLELGFYFSVGLIQLRRMRRGSVRDLTALVVLFTSLFLATFVRSQAGAGANDMGSRGFLPAQFILLLWGVELFSARILLTKRQLAMLIALAAIGFSSTLYDLTALRVYPMFFDPSPYNRAIKPPDWEHTRAVRLSALAASYAWIRAHSSADAVVQSNAARHTPLEFGLYAERPALAMGGECEGLTGRDRECSVLRGALLPLFTGVHEEGAFARACAKYPLDFLVVDDTDQVWWRKSSWIWTHPAAFSTATTKVFACR